MATYKERSKRRKQVLKEHNIEVQKEKQRLKALPKPLRKLETELWYYVDFIEVYDGYLGYSTGDLVPVEPVKNPFAVIHSMQLNFPHPHSLNDTQKSEYVRKIEMALNRMRFYFDVAFLFENKPYLYYELIYHFIENPPQADFILNTTLKKDNLSISIERSDFEY